MPLRSCHAFVLGSWIAGSFASMPHALAQNAPKPTTEGGPTSAPERPPGPVALSLTISGGVSLGAHEAGFLHYLSETFKRNPQAFQLVAVTGASAGSINALITILEGCGAPVQDPFESLFYRTWIPIGVGRLFVPDATEPTGLFSRTAFKGAVQRLLDTWNAGVPETCDLVLGVATTRLEAVPLEVRGGQLNLPRLEERFVVRVRGRGAGRPPTVSHYIDARVPFEQVLLPIDGPDAKPFEAIRDTLFASSAFPIAFPPVPLKHCMARGDGSKLHCSPAEAKTALFVDGGVFDNQPLPLAASVVKSGLIREPSGRFRWAETPDAQRDLLPKDFAFGYLDPSAKAFPALEQPGSKPPTYSAFRLLGTFLGTFVSGARSKGLVSFFADNPELRDRMLIATSRFPLASEPMEAFFGFFEEDFRRFDYVLGMLDARAAALTSDQFQRLALWNAPPRLPEQDVEALPEGRVPEGYKSFLCARAVLEESTEAERRCADPTLANFRVLLQATVERLYDHCRSLAEQSRSHPHEPSQERAHHAPAASHVHCTAAQRGAPPPVVPGVVPLRGDAWRKGKDEVEFDYVLRLLAAHHFWFRDLGLKPDEGERAPLAVRDTLVRMVSRFRDVQPEGRVVFEAARTALNALRYLPARHIVYASLGPVFETGYSFTDPRGPVPFLRAAAALKLEGVTSIASNTGTYYVGLTPLLGVEVEPIDWNGVTTQLRFGARGGALLSSGDTFGTGPCVPGSPAPCTRPVVDAYVALSIVDRVRLQVAGSVSPRTRDGESILWSIQPTIGLQLEP